jgi:hypothetical protein
MFTHSFGRVGRAATQPLVQREHFETEDTLTPAIHHAIDFFEALLPVMPPLAVSIRSAIHSPLIVYSDAASFDIAPGITHSELAFLIIDPDDPDDVPVWSYSIMPQAYYKLFDSNLHKYINIAESTALAAALFSCPDKFKDRSFIHFVDNTFALSLFVHGYANRPDCAR